MIVAKKSSRIVQNYYKKRNSDAISYALTQIKSAKIASYVKNIYLYGSSARNNQSFDSDIDLLIVLEESFHKEKNKSLFLSDLVSKLNETETYLPEIEPRFVIGDKWKIKNDTFYENVRKEGIQIW